jgi:hypothetical protein
MSGLFRFVRSLIGYNLACYECQLGNLKAAWKWLVIAFDLGDAKQVKLMALDDAGRFGLRYAPSGV